MFDQNKLIKITEDLSGTETFKKMKEVSDNYWSFQKFMDNYAGEAQELLDYLDEALSNPYIEPDLKFIKESLIKVLRTHNYQI